METEEGDTYGLAHVDAGVRFNFHLNGPVVPYANLAVTYRQATVERQFRNTRFDIEYSGGGATFGGGLAYFLSPSLALDLGLQLTLGTFTDVSAGNLTVSNLDVDAASGRLALGLSWFPSRP